MVILEFRGEKDYWMWKRRAIENETIVGNGIVRDKALQRDWYRRDASTYTHTHTDT